MPLQMHRAQSWGCAQQQQHQHQQQHGQQLQHYQQAPRHQQQQQHHRRNNRYNQRNNNYQQQQQRHNPNNYHVRQRAPRHRRLDNQQRNRSANSSPAPIPLQNTQSWGPRQQMDENKSPMQISYLIPSPSPTIPETDTVKQMQSVPIENDVCSPLKCKKAKRANDSGNSSMRQSLEGLSLQIPEPETRDASLDALKFQNKYLKARCDTLDKECQSMKQAEKHWQKKEEQLMMQMHDLQQKLRKLEMFVDTLPNKAKRNLYRNSTSSLKDEKESSYSPQCKGKGNVKSDGNSKNGNRKGNNRRSRKKRFDPRLKFKASNANTNARNGNAVRSDASWRKRN